jgi:hypothetical protein
MGEPYTPSIAANVALPWALYEPGETLCELPNVRPLLASWDAKTSRAQQAIQHYLQEIAEQLQPVIGERTDLYMSLDIDVRARERLRKGYDLENYLYPLANHLGHRRFTLATARKWAAADASEELSYSERSIATLRVGVARVAAAPDESWQHLAVMMGPGTDQKKWKQDLHDNVSANATCAPDGPLAVQLAWRAAPTRNWTALWKPTGDSLGPILGGPEAKPFSPKDDRIVDLQLHRIDDPTLGHKLQIGVWWRHE